jgi:uncharacterized protein YndB with AHSA1/START domain
MKETIEIHRPPDEVFAYVTDVTRFPEWQSDVVRVRADGDTFTTTRRIGGAERTMTQRITHVDPPRSWSAQGIDGPIRANGSVTVEPAGNGSLVTFDLDFEGHGFGRMLLPMIKRMAAKGAPISYQNLKRRLESGDRLR